MSVIDRAKEYAREDELVVLEGGDQREAIDMARNVMERESMRRRFPPDPRFEALLEKLADASSLAEVRAAAEEAAATPYDPRQMRMGGGPPSARG